MMGRLIDVDVALNLKDKDMNRVYDLTDLEEFLAGVPTVDAEPVRHAKWIHLGDGVIECSWCKASVYNDDIYRASIFGEVKNPAEYDVNPYCPNCGARMDAE